MREYNEKNNKNIIWLNFSRLSWRRVKKNMQNRVGGSKEKFDLFYSLSFCASNSKLVTYSWSGELFKF